MDRLDWARGFSLDFSPADGLSRGSAPTERRLSAMAGMYADADAAARLVAEKDPVVYAFYELDAPRDAGDLAFGTSILFPGKVGEEYFMTKGHFHSILDTAEVYYCLAGEGMLLTESPGGEVAAHPLAPGRAVYVPKGWAHRSVNTGGATLVTFFAFRADAGHDYGTIEKKGFRRLVVERDGRPQLIDNPGWA